MIDEKKYIMTKIVNVVNDKSNSKNQNIINEMTNLCILAIIFSDFEIELFFEINHFGPNFQKTILIQTLSFCCDRQKEQENYISLKYQFWILKMYNKIITTEKLNETLSNNEIEESLESLKKYIDKNIFEKSEEKFKILFLKIYYEIGIYFFYNNDFNNMKIAFDFLLNNIDKIINKKKLYFDENNIKKLLKFCEINKNEMDIDEKEEEIENYDYLEKKYNLDLSNFDLDNNIIEKDFKTKMESIKIEDNNENNNENHYKIKYQELIENSSLEFNLKYSENLLFLTFENISYLKEANEFINLFKNHLNNLSTKNNISKTEEIEILNNKKELSYYSILLIILETFFNNENKLRKNFLKNLSKTILRNTLTDNLNISGLIHCLILNFKENFKGIYNYFNDFVEFFQSDLSKNKVETIKQIVLIARILSIFNLVLNEDKNEIIIENELYKNLITIFLFWLGIEKEKNILYILIESLKIVDYLYILKIIYLGIVKFIIEKKQLNEKENFEIYDIIYDIKPKLFKTDFFIEYEIKNCTNETIKNKKINFKTDNLNINFELNNIEIYINKLFNLLFLIEKKISFFDKNLNNEKILERKNEMNFYKIVDIKNLEENNNNFKINYVLNDYLNLLKIKFEKFKQDYFSLDIIDNYNVVNEYYKNFKELLDNDYLLKLIYILSKNNKFFEAVIFAQYLKKIDSNNLVYKLLKNFILDNNINYDYFQFIWKTVYFEYLSNFYYNKKNDEALKKIKLYFKRISNHQFFKGHPLRKHFKIINFFKIIDNIY